MRFGSLVVRTAGHVPDRAAVAVADAERQPTWNSASEFRQAGEDRRKLR